MKKQILILFMAVFVLGANQAFGQATQGSSPRPFNADACESGPLNPVAGVPYDYEAEVIPLNGTAFWYATVDTQFMDDGDRVAGILSEGGSSILAADNYATDLNVTENPTGTTITWSSEALANVNDAENNFLFVVVEYTGPGGDDCENNNMKVIKIDPINAFTLHVRNMVDETPLDYDTDTEQCFDDVFSAHFDTTEHEMVMDYGTNYLDFEIIAANFTGSFTPDFQLSGLQEGQSAEVFWSYNSDFEDSNSLGTVNGAGDHTIDGPEVTTNETNTGDGVSIYVQVEISNGTFEGLNDTPITLAVMGENSEGQPNVDPDCDDVTLFADADSATQILEARPTITPEGETEFVDPQ